MVPRTDKYNFILCYVWGKGARSDNTCFVTSSIAAYKLESVSRKWRLLIYRDSTAQIRAAVGSTSAQCVYYYLLNTATREANNRPANSTTMQVFTGRINPSRRPV